MMVDAVYLPRFSNSWFMLNHIFARPFSGATVLILLALLLLHYMLFRKNSNCDEIISLISAMSRLSQLERESYTYL